MPGLRPPAPAPRLPRALRPARGAGPRHPDRGPAAGGPAAAPAVDRRHGRRRRVDVRLHHRGGAGLGAGRRLLRGAGPGPRGAGGRPALADALLLLPARRAPRPDLADRVLPRRLRRIVRRCLRDRVPPLPACPVTGRDAGRARLRGRDRAGHVLHEQHQLPQREHALQRAAGARDLLHPHPRGPVRVRGPLRPARPASPAPRARGGASDRRDAPAPARAVPAVQAQHRDRQPQVPRPQAPDRRHPRRG